jgi:hypothetical protein
MIQRLSAAFYGVALAGAGLLAWLMDRTAAVLDSGLPAPDLAVAFRAHADQATLATQLTALALLILAALLAHRHQPQRRNFTLAWLVFAIPTLLQATELEDRYFHWKRDHGLWRGEFSVAWLGGLLHCLAAAVVTVVVYRIARRAWLRRQSTEVKP